VPTLNNNDLALDFDEDMSSLGANSFDYIRMAHLNGAVMDERALLGKVFESVPPHSLMRCPRKLTMCTLV